MKNKIKQTVKMRTTKTAFVLNLHFEFYSIFSDLKCYFFFCSLTVPFIHYLSMKCDIVHYFSSLRIVVD